MGGVFESVAEPTSERCFSEDDPFEFEERFLLTRAQVTRFFASLARHAAVEIYDRERPIAYTRTTYLDTDDFAFYRSCDRPGGAPAAVSRIRDGGVAGRRADPVVARRPGAQADRRDVALEGAAVGDADRAAAADRTPAGSATIRSRSSSSCALGVIQQELRHPTMAPRLTTWYRRAALTAESGRIRITLDERLTFCRPQIGGVIGAEVAPTPSDIFAVGTGAASSKSSTGGRGRRG